MTKKMLIFSLLFVLLLGAQGFADSANPTHKAANQPMTHKIKQSVNNVTKNPMGTLNTRNMNPNPTYRTTATNNNPNNNWSWIGLLGLVGLAGLFGRNRNPDPQR